MGPEINTGNENQPAKSTSATLYRHDRRPEWGLAVILWEENGKRAYQFADGKVRVIKEGFYRLFSPATAPGDGSGRSVVRMAKRRAGGDDALLPSVRHQVHYFRGEYPEGFRGEDWHAAHRGQGRRLKRHRDPVLDAAAKQWSLEAMNDKLARQDWPGIKEAMISVLSLTDLITSGHLKKLKTATPSESLARSFVSLIHAQEEEVPRAIERFREAVQAAGGPGNSWPLVTAPCALMRPNEEVCVRPSVMKVQARILIPGFKPTSKPNAREYAEYRRAARALAKELGQFELVPRDLIDVYDFVWVTLRPAVRDEVMAAIDDDDQTPSVSADADADATDEAEAEAA